MDWLAFFEANMVHYVTSGRNTARGNASIACPLCGPDDPSTHMGVQLTSENWGCLRDPTHRGRKAESLIAALLGCSYGQAKLVAAQFKRYDPNALGDPTNLFEPTSKPLNANAGQALQPPPLRALNPDGTTARFWRYLAQRGFDDVDRLASEYRVACCLTGKWKDRVIIPLYQQGKLIAWTGRALINPINAPRYLSSEGNAIKQTVFNEDDLNTGGETLIIVEGPFDALKLDYYGKAIGARATCGFGTSLSMDQIVILNRLRKGFKHTVLLFDAGAVEPSFYAADYLPGVTVGYLPDGVDDPGDLDKNQVLELIRCMSPSTA